MAHQFCNKYRHTLPPAYFRYYKFLLRLPRWHQNRKIIPRFGLIDMTSWIRSSSDDLCKKTIYFIHVYDPMQSFFPYWYWLISPCCLLSVWFFFLAVYCFCLNIILRTLCFFYTFTDNKVHSFIQSAVWPAVWNASESAGSLQARDLIIYVCREFHRPSELTTQHAACLSKNQPKDIDAIYFHSESEI